MEELEARVCCIFHLSHFIYDPESRDSVSLILYKIHRSEVISDVYFSATNY